KIRCRLLARSRHPGRSAIWSLLGEERTCGISPRRTSISRNFDRFSPVRTERGSTASHCDWQMTNAFGQGSGLSAQKRWQDFRYQEETMRRIAITLLSFAALVATVDLAIARDGCGLGRYFNGYRCVGVGYQGYGGPYGYGADRPIYGQSNFGAPEVWFPVHYNRYGQPYCAERGYT